MPVAGSILYFSGRTACDTAPSSRKPDPVITATTASCSLRPCLDKASAARKLQLQKVRQKFPLDRESVVLELPAHHRHKEINHPNRESPGLFLIRPADKASQSWTASSVAPRERRENAAPSPSIRLAGRLFQELYSRQASRQQDAGNS